MVWASIRVIFGLGVVSLGLGACQPTVTTQSPEGSTTSSAAATSNAVALDITATFPGTGTYSSLTGSLTAASVCTGQRLFGSSGSAVCQSGSTSAAASAANVLTGKDFWDVTGLKVTGTMAVGSNIVGSDGSRVITITEGYYDGTKTVTANDTDLVAGNIASGVNLFGVAGSASLEAHSNCSGANQSGCVATASFKSQSVPATAATAADVIVGKEFYVGGALQTGTLTNQGNLNVANAWPGAGYYGASPSNAPIASQLCTGTSVLGVSGSGNCSGISMNSNVYRDQATTAISQSAETTTYSGTDLPAGYRDVPVIAKDDDGYVSAGVTSPQITLVNRSTFANCGTNENSISARISACATVNGANATWDGATKANAGQGAWKLVTRAAANKEVWQDQRTGLLWSSILSTDNWCRAAGNAESGDPSNYCNSTTYQPDYPSAQSWCAEVGPTTMMEASGSGENWVAGSYNAAKGYMGKNSSPSVRWRLPTIYDFEQANINGIRFVMPEMVKTGSGYEWSASVAAVSRSDAWVFVGGLGFVYNVTRLNPYPVRCVGR